MPKQRKCTRKPRKGDGKNNQGSHINEERDMISDLPDSVLAHILGKLPTKYAVGTSILSTRWKHLFAQIPNSNISINDSERLNPDPDYSNPDRDFIYERRKANFVKFMYNLLNVTLLDVPRIHKFHLDLYINYDYEETQEEEFGFDDYHEHLSKWVSAALRLNVSYLWVSCPPSFLGPSESLFCCTSLVEIMLNWSVGMIVPNSVSLPNLKSLYLKNVLFHDNDLERVLAGCNVLEELSLWKCRFEQRNISHLMHVFRIVSPSVKNFKMSECYKDYKYGIELDMPALIFLVYDDHVPEYFLMKNLNSLRKAHLDAWPTYEQYEGLGLVHYLKVVADLIRGCTNVEFLSLPNHSTDATGYSLPSLCSFHNLIELELHDIGAYGWMLLPHLLKNAPNFEVLVFREGFAVHKGCYKIFTSHMSRQFPTWLSLNLQRIKFEEFGGEVEEMQLLKYFLKHGKVLRKIEINISPLCPEKLLNVMSKVLALQRRTKNCVIDLMPRAENYVRDRYFGNMRKF